MINFVAMTGAEIYNRDADVYSEYASLLQTLYLHLGENVLYRLLEQAEKQNKKLAINESIPVAIGDDDILESSIIFV